MGFALSDFVKDSIVAISLLRLIGASTIIEQPTLFSSQIFIMLAASSCISMLTGGARTGCTNPLLFLGPAAQESYQTRSCLIIYKLINFLLAPLILPLLVYSLVKEQESIKDLLKGKSIDISLEKLVGQKMKYCKSVQQALLSFKQHELALEMFIQIFIQLVMLMLNNTETATNTGLQAVFN